MAVKFSDFLDRSRFVYRLGKEFQTHDVLRFKPPTPQKGELFFVCHPDLAETVFTAEPLASSKHLLPLLPPLRSRVEHIMGRGGFIHPGGSEWQRARRMVQPAVSRRGIVHATGAVADAVGRLEARWSRIVGKGQPVDICSEMRRLAVDVMFKGLFSHELGERAEGVYRDTNLVMHAFNDPLPLSLPTLHNLQFRRAVRRLHAVMDALIQERRQDATPPEDALTTLVQARDAEGRGFTDKEVRDEMFSLYLGSFILGVAVAWTWYALAIHPEYERTMAEEAASVLRGGAPKIDDLSRLNLPNLVFMEALRLYPSSWSVFRYSRDPMRLGEIDIPADSTFLTVGYFTHRHPEFWKDPEKFYPERFAGNALKDMHKFAYYPFAGGPRKCLGFHLASVLGQMILASLSQRYTLRLAKPPRGELDVNFGFEFEPRRPLHMIVERRS